jgi:hypothetical protein
MQRPIIQGTKPSIFRWIHIVFAIPIIGYIYSPFENFPAMLPQPGLSSSLTCHCGTLDVERPRRSTIYLEQIGNIKNHA